MAGDKPKRVNRAAVENAAEFDRRKGGETMPPDVRPVSDLPPRYPHKQRINQAEGSAQQPGIDHRMKVKVAGKKYGLAFCRLVFEAAYPHGGKPGDPAAFSQDVLADTFDIPKVVVNAILMKGLWGKL